MRAATERTIWSTSGSPRIARQQGDQRAGARVVYWSFHHHSMLKLSAKVYWDCTGISRLAYTHHALQIQRSSRTSMRHTTNACPHRFPPRALSDESAGMLLGLIGVAIFSLTLPFTRMAVAELDPLLVALGRALGAAVLAAHLAGLRRAPLPPRAALLPLALVARGCVIGFPLADLDRAAHAAGGARRGAGRHAAAGDGAVPAAARQREAVAPASGSWRWPARRSWSASRCARAAAACSRPTC